MLRSLLQKNNIIGMIHALPLPGSPGFSGSVDKIVDVACQEAEIYAKYEIGGVIIENMHDIPYVKPKQLGPETIASMSRVCTAVRSILPKFMACGVQILAGCNKEALAVALASNCDFIRAEGYVFAHIGDEGYLESCAGSLLRYRNHLKSDRCIKIFTDIKKKHSSHSITNDVVIEETAKAAEFFNSDGVIITGSSTGVEVDINDYQCIKNCITTPVIVGSGITFENMHKFQDADALIVGSHFKYNGRWQNGLDENRLKKFLKKHEQHQ